MSSRTIQVFLTSIGQDQKDIFTNKFINGIKNNQLAKNTDYSKIYHMWGFIPSEKTYSVWKNINKNDWVLFDYNGRYSFAGKIEKKSKSMKIADKIFGENENKNLLIFCKEIFEIKKGFQKTNNEMGFKTNIPEIHRIKLIQSNEKYIRKIINNHKNFENYLGISNFKIKKKNITEIIPSSLRKETKKIKTIILRRVRDTKKSEKLKNIYQNKCQICNYSFPDYIEPGYSEVHHVWPMANNGDDDFDNMLVLCPNHHTEFDYLVIRFNSDDPKKIEDLEGNSIGTISYKNKHVLNKKNIEFHNLEVRRVFVES